MIFKNYQKLYKIIFQIQIKKILNNNYDFNQFNIINNNILIIFFIYFHFKIGIPNLLPHLQNLPKNSTIAIDGNCTLYALGTFQAPNIVIYNNLDRLIKSLTTSFRRIVECKNIKYAIIVFDGKPTIAKQSEIDKRNQVRQQALKRAKQLVNIEQQDHRLHQEFIQCCLKALVFTDELIEQIMEQLTENFKELGLEKKIFFIHAPCESDAQLAHLSKCKAVDYVMTIDSDLILYDLDKYIYKFKSSDGSGQLYTRNSIYQNDLVKDYQPLNLKKICILSGCDYVVKCVKCTQQKVQAINQQENSNLAQMVNIILNKYQINKEQYNSNKEFIDAVILAFMTFKHQIVYDPVSQRCCYRVPIKEDQQFLDAIGNSLKSEEQFKKYKVFATKQQEQLFNQIVKPKCIEYQENQFCLEENVCYQNGELEESQAITQ